MAQPPRPQPVGKTMEPGIKSVFSSLEEPGKSHVAGDMEDCILSDSEEEGITLKDLPQDVLPQLPEAHSPNGEGACGKLTHQKRSSKKLALTADSQKPHTEEKPHKCPECRKSFKGHTRLLNHLQTHTREKMFECVECGKSFRRKANLVVHQRIHTGERPYKCKDCEKAFSRTSSLVAHRKTHVKKKAFACTTCRKSFSGNAALSQHQKVHKAEKPYRCAECGTTFRLCSDFIRHQQAHSRRASEHAAAADHSELSSLHHKEAQTSGAEKGEADCLSLVLEELKNVRENMDMLLLNQQSQLQVLQEIQKQLTILLRGNDLMNSNLYSLGVLLGRQAASAASLSFPLLNPSTLFCENANRLSQSAAPGVLPPTQPPVSQYPATSTN